VVIVAPISRRQLIGGAVAIAVAPGIVAARQRSEDIWSLPIRNPDGLPGDGFFIRHGFACENTWFNPGWWHTAEDWYRDGDANTAGAEVLAIHAGKVLWIGSEYPGRVVLVRHPDGLIAMYGHLDHAVDVAEGDAVVAGQVLGRVLDQTGGRAPSHLHFELRTFVLNPIVNGDTPKYAVNCGYQCPPGPGYWPMSDPQHPAELGWRNPSHVIATGVAAGTLPDAVVPAGADGFTLTAHEEPDDASATITELTLRAGDRFRVEAIEASDPSSTETSALGYRVWYRLDAGWVRALVLDMLETGSDGRPSTLRPILLPQVVS
jgi:murein DD-endopeptidase MepM/ murein hydrolase activator NlpD